MCICEGVCEEMVYVEEVYEWRCVCMWKGMHEEVCICGVCEERCAYVEGVRRGGHMWCV